LEIIVLRMPPLRERGPDRMRLAAHLRDEICRDYGLAPRPFADDVAELIEGYFWPGNVRELRNCLEQILLLEDELKIAARHFHLRGRMKQRPVTAKLSTSDSGSLKVDVADEGVALQKVEDALIDRTLEVCDG